MEYDRLLEHFDSNAGQKHQTALAIYYFEEYEEQKSVTQSDVRQVVGDSRSTIKTSSVSQYFTRLNDDGWITPTNEEGYRLTNPGRDGVTNLIDEDVLDNPREDLFIDTDVTDDRYYEQLIDNINKCYQCRIYDATLVLSRKLFEHLVYKILQGHYGGDRTEMFFDTDRKLQLGFEDLIDNLRDSVPDLRQYSRDLSKNLVDVLDQFRQEGNAGAHSVRVDVSEDEIENLADEATRTFEILYDVWVGIRIANDGA